MTTHSPLSHHHNYFSYSLGIGLAAFLIALVIYLALVSLTIAHVARENNYSAAITAATSELGSLEGQYVAIESSLTLDYAASLGLSEPASTLFVTSAPALSVK